MNKPRSSLILSPNLGCPEMVSIHALNERGFRVVIAAPLSEDFDRAAYALRACPSFEGEGLDFMLEVTDVRKLENEALPSRFEDVAETRELISTTLRTKFFPDMHSGPRGPSRGPRLENHTCERWIGFRARPSTIWSCRSRGLWLAESGTHFACALVVAKFLNF